MSRDSLFVPEHKTNILPLRWLANYIFHPISMLFFRIGLKANHQIYESNEGYSVWDEIKEKIGWKLYNLLDKPYTKWGTYYIFKSDIVDNIKQDLSGDSWDDYDENGIPYWYYLWSTDEATGDGWRLVLDKTTEE